MWRNFVAGSVRRRVLRLICRFHLGCISLSGPALAIIAFFTIVQHDNILIKPGFACNLPDYSPAHRGNYSRRSLCIAPARCINTGPILNYSWSGIANLCARCLTWWQVWHAVILLQFERLEQHFVRWAFRVDQAQSNSCQETSWPGKS